MLRYRWASLPALAAELSQAQERNQAQVLEEARAAAESVGPGGGRGQRQLRVAGDNPAGAQSASGAGLPKVLLPRAFSRDPTQDDAFVTLMQWLYSRIPDTR